MKKLKKSRTRTRKKRAKSRIKLRRLARKRKLLKGHKAR